MLNFLVIIAGISVFLSIESPQIISIEDFYNKYNSLKGVQILDIYDVNCYNKDLSKVNNYLLKARENYLKFLDYYHEPALYGKFWDYAINLTENTLILGILNKYKDETISDFSKFSYYLALVLKEYGEIIDKDYKTLCWIGADQPDFPGILRERYIEYKKLVDYLKQRNTIKDYERVKELKLYQRNFLIALSFTEESSDVSKRLLSYEYLFKSISQICKNHQEINKIISRYLVEIESNEIELRKTYMSLLKQYKSIEKECLLYSNDIYNSTVNFVKIGSTKTIDEVCLEIKDLLNNIDFKLYDQNNEDYIYLNYKKINEIDKKLKKISNLIKQVKEDMYNMNKSCFDKLNYYINNENDSIIKSFLLEKYKTGKYDQCVNALMFYESIKGNTYCDIYKIKKILDGLDSVGFDVSNEIELLKEYESSIDKYIIYCKELESDVYKKYLKFLKELSNLRNRYNYLNKMYSKIFGYGENLDFKDEFEEYIILKDKIKELESILKDKITQYLKNNTVINYEFSNVPECGYDVNFDVIVQVNNDLGIIFNNVSFEITDMFGRYIVRGTIKPGINKFVYKRNGKISVCKIRPVYIKGNNWDTIKVYAVNVSSLSDRVKYCFNNELVLETNSPCVFLDNGENFVETISKTKFDYVLYNTSGYIRVYMPYDVFYLYTDIKKQINTTQTYSYVNGSVVFVFYNITKDKIFKWNYIENKNVTPIVLPIPYVPLIVMNDSKKDKSNHSVFDDTLHKYRKILLDLIDEKMKKFKYYPVILEKLIKLKNKIDNKNNLSLKDLIQYQKEIENIKYEPKDFDPLVNFVCSISDCDILVDQYERYRKGLVSEETFKSLLYSEIKKNKQSLIEKYDKLHIQYNLRRLKTCFGEDDPIYKKYYNEYENLKEKFFKSLNKNSSNIMYYFNKLQNLNAKIESLVEIQKQKAKYMIDRLKLLLRNVEDPEQYKDEINNIVSMYKNGQYNEVISKIKYLIKNLNIKPEEENSFDYSSLTVIIVFIILIIGLYFTFNNKNEKKKIVIKRSEEI